MQKESLINFNMIQDLGLPSSDNCCGCGACIDSCPVNALTFKEDEFGFIMPSVDSELCIKCKKCSKVCPSINQQQLLTPIKVYAATSTDNELSMKSSSGGIFATIAKHVLNQGGIVFGTAFDDEFNARVIAVEKLNDLHKLQGSKYVQSNMNGAYKKIEEELKSDRPVLFCGTGCQVAGVRNYLKKDYDNLILIDLVCHGVPNNKMFKDYIALIEKKHKKKVVVYSFRDKQQGQDEKGKIIFDNGFEKKVPSYKSSYYGYFLDNTILRKSCHSCKYATQNRCGDLTLCDFWGAGEEIPQFVDHVSKQSLCGVSAIMVNNSKGSNIIDNLNCLLLMQEVEYMSVFKHNQNLLGPTKLTDERKTVLDNYAKNDYSSIDKLYRRTHGTKIFLKDIFNFLPKKLKSFIHKRRHKQ